MSTRAEFHAVIESNQRKIEEAAAARAALKAIDGLYREEKRYHKDDIGHWEMVLLNLEDIEGLARHIIKRCEIGVPLDLNSVDGSLLAHVDSIDGVYNVHVVNGGAKTIEDTRRLSLYLEEFLKWNAGRSKQQ